MKLSRLPDWRLALAAGASFCTAALLVACGGGGGDAGSTAVGTAAVSYSQGAITGFGSVFVGGVRFDDTAATVTDDDDNASSSTALKLGMMVQVDAGAVDRSASAAIARAIRWGSEVVGPVGAINLTASTAQVLGQTVLVTTSTVFDSTLAGGLPALTAGAVLEVHGILDPANSRIVATRIEPRAGATFYKIRGVVANLDTTAKTFTINGQLISYAGLAAGLVPAGLTNGQIVRARLQTTQVSGAWVATALRGGLRLPDADRDAEVEGAITVFTSATDFEISGLKVNATNAVFADGTAGVVLGARLEVRGTVSNGILVATRVEIEARRTPDQRPLELRGNMSNLNTTDKTFALRDVTVWYGGSTLVYVNGTAAALANSAKVEVDGVLSSDRTRVEARRIEFK